MHKGKSNPPTLLSKDLLLEQDFQRNRAQVIPGSILSNVLHCKDNRKCLCAHDESWVSCFSTLLKINIMVPYKVVPHGPE